MVTVRWNGPPTVDKDYKEAKKVDGKTRDRRCGVRWTGGRDYPTHNYQAREEAVVFDGKG